MHACVRMSVHVYGPPYTPCGHVRFPTCEVRRVVATSVVTNHCKYLGALKQSLCPGAAWPSGIGTLGGGGEEPGISSLSLPSCILFKLLEVTLMCTHC